MAINIVRFEHQGVVGWGVLQGIQIARVEGDFATTGDFIAGTSLAALKALAPGQLAVSEVKLLSPVTRSQQFVCQGANYRQHMIESGLDPDAKHYNMIFTKAASCIVAADSDLIKPKGVRFLDYEVELGLIIKREITGSVKVTDANLLDYVAGLVVVNDYSARDVQIPQMQFYKGKSFRTFGPVGPYLCLLEPGDAGYLKNLNLSLKVNGQSRQADSTANMVFGPAETLTELSGVHDFAPGDLIATGTPHGCALTVPSPAKQRLAAALLSPAKRMQTFLKMQEARANYYLKAGDVVETGIRSADGVIDLGVQRNRVVEQG
ncbi:fumarylacetoacetate hydrolase family protein [Halopseudomonas sabulinigri]|uniref:Fumarylacetoacetate hydrolase family protein n=1 Tax=Halopseudomonas sabulinigri TaxID=472181 RepID=A0ABP9ZT99_9GAMM